MQVAVILLKLTFLSWIKKKGKSLASAKLPQLAGTDAFCNICLMVYGYGSGREGEYRVVLRRTINRNVSVLGKRSRCDT